MSDNERWSPAKSLGFMIGAGAAGWLLIAAFLEGVHVIAGWFR